MNQLPKEFFMELTYMTIAQDARWMEYEEGMEDFALAQQISDDETEHATVYLCGYIPQLSMELAITAIGETGVGTFYSLRREGENEIRMQQFALNDHQADFELNMLMYAATTQIITREREQSYHNLAQELASAKGGCSGCSGCGTK